MSAAPRPRLVNSPLVEVAYELRFPGNFAVTAGLDRLQSMIGAEFSQLLVPNVEPGEAPVLKHYRFATSDQLELVGVALNSFLFSTKRYTVFDDFATRINPLLEAFAKIYRPSAFTRVGLRFTNLLPFMPGSPARLHPWLQLGASVPSCLERPVAEYQGTYVFDYDGGVKLRVTTGRAQQTRELVSGGRHQMLIDAFLLDLDCYCEGEIEPDRDVAFLQQAHTIIDRAFFDLLTPDALAQLEGRI